MWTEQSRVWDACAGGSKQGERDKREEEGEEAKVVAKRTFYSIWIAFIILLLLPFSFFTNLGTVSLYGFFLCDLITICVLGFFLASNSSCIDEWLFRYKATRRSVNDPYKEKNISKGNDNLWASMNAKKRIQNQFWNYIQVVRENWRFCWMFKLLWFCDSRVPLLVKESSEVVCNNWTETWNDEVCLKLFAVWCCISLHRTIIIASVVFKEDVLVAVDRDNNSWLYVPRVHQLGKGLLLTRLRRRCHLRDGMTEERSWVDHLPLITNACHEYIAGYCRSNIIMIKN